MENYQIFTSESVSEGHPDKVCDQISDAIVDAILQKDKNGRIACEVFATDNFILIGGEITTSADVDYAQIARRVLRDIGYTNAEYGIDADSAEIIVRINEQSADISRGITRDKEEELGAGDQGMMFGYASNETKGLMPLATVVAHKLMRIATEKRKNGAFKHARPDMKAQVTVRYYDSGKVALDTVVMSVQHDKNIDKKAFKSYIYDEIILPTIKSFNLNEDFVTLINPAGDFVIGGPKGDAGLTGRKIIVDTYGSYGRHGGGAFSGKDPSKVDRSGAYMARYIAKNIVAAKLADKVEIQLSYAIGVSEPLGIALETFGTAKKYTEQQILQAVRAVFDCRPGVIIKNFALTTPSFAYEKLAVLGHFGRPDITVPWEKTDKVNALLAYLEKN
ncbi:MAG TPA: methionine adenosyltransferase [Bacilli bacterium]|nr:methionine adenosyltransferase [Bacilli bacterium]